MANLCVKVTDNLEDALLAAGENRIELEKALDRYSQMPLDCFRLRLRNNALQHCVIAKAKPEAIQKFIGENI